MINLTNTPFLLACISGAQYQVLCPGLLSPKQAPRHERSEGAGRSCRVDCWTSGIFLQVCVDVGSVSGVVMCNWQYRPGRLVFRVGIKQRNSALKL